jgi:tRNA pseudouridine55 synthase
MHGLLLVDKPAGMTSHSVVAKLRKKLGTKKIGHAGTLDPSATGLLVLCIGHATKISDYIMDSDKIYRTKFLLGKVTTTYDLEGEIVSSSDASQISKEKFLAELPRFTGEILQTPPIYSAIKVQGRKLYQYARSNTEVEIPQRSITIHSLELLSYEAPFGVLQIHCSKGTYVRSLIHDIGQRLGVGACVETIHRVQSSPFSIENAISLTVLLEMEKDEIIKKFISVNQALAKHFHTIEVSEEDEARIRNGVEYSKTNIQEKDFTTESLFLFVSQMDQHAIAIAKWGNKDRIEFKRVL